VTAAFPFGYLSADVVAETGVSDSYLSFLVRVGIVRPLKHRNGRTNVYTDDDLETVRWAIARRGELTVDEMRLMVNRAVRAHTDTGLCICPAVTHMSGRAEAGMR